MQQDQHSRLLSFIWNIADNVLRDLYVRGKYRNVILPITVRHRLDAVLEPTKQAVLNVKAALEHAGIETRDQPLREAIGQAQPRAVFVNRLRIRGVGDAIRSGGTWC
jgi:type I restriction enzyme M protein